MLYLLTEPAHFIYGILLAFPLGAHRVRLGFEICQLLPELLQALLAGLVLLLAQGRRLDLQLHHAARHLVQLSRHGVDSRAHHRARLIHEVNRLVRKETIGDIPVGQDCRTHDGVVLDAHAMVHFVAFAQSTKDGDGIFHRGRLNQYRLEAALQRRVLLDMLAVFVQRGGPYAVQFSTGEHRLEHVARVRGPLCLSSPHNRVHFIDE